MRLTKLTQGGNTSSSCICVLNSESYTGNNWVAFTFRVLLRELERTVIYRVLSFFCGIKSELNVMKRDDFENKIIEVFRKANRDLTLDEVTVGYFRLHNEQKERKQIMSKLYNMSRSTRPAIESIAGKKGVYRLIMGEED